MKKIKFPKKLRRDWLKALRSGEYEQCDGELRSEYNKSYCCLGVLGKVLKLKDEDLNGKGDLTSKGFEFKHTIKFPKALVQFNKKKKTRKNTDFCNDLISMNDDNYDSFNTIADYIEEKTVGV